MGMSLYIVGMLYVITWLSIKYKIFQLKQITEPTVIEQAAYMLIAAGASMFVVGFLGYCGTSHESRCLL